MSGKISYQDRRATIDLHEYIDENSDLVLTKVEMEPKGDEFSLVLFTVEGRFSLSDPRDEQKLDAASVTQLLDQFERLQRLEPTSLTYEAVAAGTIAFEFFCYGLEDENDEIDE